jgi:hypothetical protein
VSVTLVQPGFVHSDSFRNVYWSEGSRLASADGDDPYYQYYRSMTPFIARMMSLSPATPEAIARRILRVIEMRRPPLRVAVTPDARLFGLLRRWLPRAAYHWLLYRFLPGVQRWGGPRSEGGA